MDCLARGRVDQINPLLVPAVQRHQTVTVRQRGRDTQSLQDVAMFEHEGGVATAGGTQTEWAVHLGFIKKASPTEKIKKTPGAEVEVTALGVS
jgi:hypothetical protein